jgi:hypothetical protein
LSKGLREQLAEKDWSGPTSDLIYTVFLLLRDALEILALLAIALCVKWLLGYLNVPPIQIYDFEIRAEQIVKNFDYMLLVLFLAVQAFRLLRGMIRS